MPHILGEPFTILRAWANVTLLLTCNCGAGEQVGIVESMEAECPACHTRYNAKFNIMTQKLEMAVMKVRAPLVEVQ